MAFHFDLICYCRLKQEDSGEDDQTEQKNEQEETDSPFKVRPSPVSLQKIVYDDDWNLYFIKRDKSVWSLLKKKCPAKQHK